MFFFLNSLTYLCSGRPSLGEILYLPCRVRKVARFSISLNLELLFCKIFDCKECVFLVCPNSIYTAACTDKHNFQPARTSRA